MCRAAELGETSVVIGGGTWYPDSEFPMHIVFDHPGRQTRHTFARMIARLAGGLLVCIGLLASVIAIPSGIVTLGDLLAMWQHDAVYPPDFPVRQVELAFAASTVLAIVCLRYGRRLVRGRRSIVLFLRRFGYRGSMQVVTFAVANTIGSSWRLVTLDDDAIAPVGVDSSTRLAFSVGERIARLAVAAGKGIIGGFQLAVGLMWVVLALQAIVVAPDWQRLLRDGTLETYLEIFSMIMKRRIPSAYFGPTLPGAFAILGTAAAFGFVGLLVVFAALVAFFPLFGIVTMATSSAQALRKAEEQKKQTILDSRHIAAAVLGISRRGHQTFAPRLVVVRVATPVWRETVSAFASVSAASIIDVSEPTENLLWELAELEKRSPGRFILIGEHARLSRCINVHDSSPAEPNLDARMATLLADRDVLAYTTDRKGMRRFAHALYGVLLDMAHPQSGSK
jgi:hypothetical protein